MSPDNRSAPIAMTLHASHQKGFTLIEISILVALVGLLAAIAIPNLVRARTQSCQQSCIANLRHIDAAIHQYAFESRLPAQTPIDPHQLIPFLRSSPICPTGGTTFQDSYLLTTVEAVPQCRKMTATHALPATTPILATVHTPTTRPIHAAE